MILLNAGRVSAVIFSFLVTLLILCQIVPGPYSRTDLVVIGTIPTLVAMLAIFGLLPQSRQRTKPSGDS